MTVVTHVSAKTMEQRTGFKKALGYAFPKTDEILIRKGLPKKLEAKVKQHEEEHIAKGEEGPGLKSFFKKIAGPVLAGVGFLVGGPAGAKIGAGIGGAISSSSSAKKATKAQVDAANQEIAFARESRDLIRADTAPYRESGVTALNALMSMVGLPMGSGRTFDEESGQEVATQGPSLGPAIRGGGLRAGDNNLTRWGRGDMTGFDRGSQFNDPTFRKQRYHGGKVYRALGGPVGWGGPNQVRVGEEGPEAFIGNDGSQQVVGANGPENFQPPQDGTIIPASDAGRVWAGGQGPNDLTNPNHPDYQGVPSGLSSEFIPDPNQNSTIVPNGQLSGFIPDPNQSGVSQLGGPVPDNSIIPAGQFGPNTGAVPENPGGQPGQYNFQTDPGYGFRIGEGMRALERGAAARGGLLSGGFARKALRYAQDYASQEYSNVYNRISNIAGMGQVGTAQANQASLYTSGQVGGALSNAGFARASGYTAQGNIGSNLVNQIPWGDIFKKKSGGGASTYNYNAPYGTPGAPPGPPGP